MHSVKQRLYENCLAGLQKRVDTLLGEIRLLQDSANQETKSTVGDKYETGRSMAQIEIDNLRSQLAEALRMKQDLLQIDYNSKSIIATPGSLLFTSRGNFYIAVHAGQQQVDDQTFFAVSPASPIAQKLLGKKVGDSFVLNQQEFTILRIQ